MWKFSFFRSIANFLLLIGVICCSASRLDAGMLLSGHLLIADRGGDGFLASVLTIDPTTGIQTVISSGGYLATPIDVAIAGDGSILVSDQTAFGGFGGIIRLDPNTGLQTVVSFGGSFRGPAGISLAADGSIFVAEPSGVNRVARIDPLTGSQTTLASGGFLQRPVDVVLDVDNTLLVADIVNQIVRVDPNNGTQTLLSNLGTGRPRSIAVSATGRIFIADESIPNFPSSNTVGIREIDRVTGIATNISVAGLFSSPWGIAVGGNGDIFVSDTFRVISVNPDSGQQTLISSFGNLRGPTGIVVVPDQATNPIPEPSSLILFTLGTVGLGFMERRRRKRKMAA